MTEERKHAILFAATLLCARKLIETIDSDRPNMAKQYFVDRAVEEAAFILERIERRWPAEAGRLSSRWLRLRQSWSRLSLIIAHHRWEKGYRIR
jgi:hypothetical protein